MGASLASMSHRAPPAPRPPADADANSVEPSPSPAPLCTERMGHGRDVDEDATLVLVDAAGGLRVPDLVEMRA